MSGDSAQSTDPRTPGAEPLALLVSWAGNPAFTGFGDAIIMASSRVSLSLALLSLLSASLARPPSIYWQTVPTGANETLVVAGAGLAGATVKICSSPASCHDTVPSPAAVWEQSVQVVLPSNLSPGACVSITGGNLTEAGSPIVLSLNAPDVWWVTSANVAAMRNGSLQSDPKHPSWINTTITAGESLRIFGRGLAWVPEQPLCVPGSERTSASDTRLLLNGQPISTAVNANCYEATFATAASLAPGGYSAAVETAWGQATFGITVLAPPASPAPPPLTLDVDAQFNGSLVAALDHATTLPDVRRKRVVLGSSVYNLTTGLVVPPNTTLVGDTTASSRLEFSVTTGPKTCEAPVAADFYDSSCDASKRSCFTDVGVIEHVSNSSEVCCGECSSRANCNAFTHEYQKGRGWLCVLKACKTPSGAWSHDCPSTPRPGAQFASAYMDGSGSDATNAITVSSDVTLQNFTVTVTTATTIAEFVAVFMPPSSQRLKVEGLDIVMLQNNVSNALKVFGTQFEVSRCTASQVGSCLWPGYGPQSDHTPFQPSTTIWMQGAEDGWVHDNTFYWRCSFMDLDVSDRVIFEDNRIHSTETGVVPHGNSISGYQYRTHPSSRFWSFARNLMTRPPSDRPEDVQQWTQRETVTTDGSGPWASGWAVGVTPTGGLLLSANMSAQLQDKNNVVLVGGRSLLTLKVLGGPGTGQTRLVTGWDNSTQTLTLESPLDGWFQPGPGGSYITIDASFGYKAIVANVFNWTEVVQWYSTTQSGVMADNVLTDCNVRSGGNVGNASMGAYGACYHGPGPVWFTEFTANKQTRSDGISLFDNLRECFFLCHFPLSSFQNMEPDISEAYAPVLFRSWGPQELPCRF